MPKRVRKPAYQGDIVENPDSETATELVGSIREGARIGRVVLAANLKAGTIYIFERAKPPRRSRDQQCIPAIRYVGMNGHKYMFEKVGIHDAQDSRAGNEGKIFLSKGALEYLAYQYPELSL